MTLEIVFYCLGIIVLSLNLVALIVLSYVGYQAWKKYQQIEQKFKAGALASAAAWAPKITLLPLVFKAIKEIRKRR